MEEECFFCKVWEEQKEKFVYDNDSFYVRLDDFPVNPGHCDIVSKRHVVSLFDLTKEEWLDLKDALKKTKEFIDKEYHPDAYNVGVNEGEAAGRTIHHLHIQFIPRYKNDVPNPKGGIRNVIPEKGDYTK